MGWIVRISSKGFERNMNAGVTTSQNCKVTTITCHIVSPLNRGQTMAPAATPGYTAAASSATWRNEQVCQRVLSALAGLD